MPPLLKTLGCYCCAVCLSLRALRSGRESCSEMTLSTPGTNRSKHWWVRLGDFAALSHALSGTRYPYGINTHDGVIHDVTDPSNTVNHYWPKEMPIISGRSPAFFPCVFFPCHPPNPSPPRRRFCYCMLFSRSLPRPSGAYRSGRGRETPGCSGFQRYCWAARRSLSAGLTPSSERRGSRETWSSPGTFW